MDTRPVLHAQLLGPFIISVAEQPLNLRSQKQRALLVRLLMSLGRPVAVEPLGRHLCSWGGTAPDNEVAALYVHMTRLRRVLARADARLSGAIVTEPGAYRLAAAGVLVDIAAYRNAESAAQCARERGAAAEEHDCIMRALSLWRGELLEDVPFRHLYQEESLQLRESQLASRERFHELQIELGRADHAVVGLRALVNAHPLRESAWHLLMRALTAAGRGAEAIATFGTVRGLLVRELGVGPSAELMALFQKLLRSEQTVTS